MKILFLCGSLEAGRDGVGDYISCLSKEIIGKGHQVCVIAVNDPYAKQVLRSTDAWGEMRNLIVRIPALMPQSKRFSLAQEEANNFNPDWLSLQFVPYSFNFSGLPVLLIYYLKKLAKGRKMHMMFHETWIDFREQWKQIPVSLIQRVIVKCLLVFLNPAVIHTHLPLYHFRLRKLGFKPGYLPVFSNVPFLLKEPVQIDNKIFQIGIFSQAEDNQLILSFIEKLGSELMSKQIKPVVLLIGEIKPPMKALGNSIRRLKNFDNAVFYSGFLSPSNLSETLKTCTIGLTTLPRHVLGKSGSVAAFLSHGIPVAAPNYRWFYKKGDVGFCHSLLSDSIILDPDPLQFPRAKKAATEARRYLSQERIAGIFLSDLAITASVEASIAI